MPKFIKVSLSKEERAKLNQLSRQPNLPARVTMRLEMVRLSDVGLTIPQIAANLEAHHQTVRKYLKAFQTGQFEALYDRAHPAPVTRLQNHHLQALEKLLDQAAQDGERTYTMPQLVDWLWQHYQLKVSRGHLTRLLKARGYRYKRTKRSVAHLNTNPDLQTAKIADLETFNF